MSWENWFRGHFLNPGILSSVPSERDLGRHGGGKLPSWIGVFPLGLESCLGKTTPVPGHLGAAMLWLPVLWHAGSYGDSPALAS